jgi:hypothetical protein
MNINGIWVGREFASLYEHGGVFLADEMDNEGFASFGHDNHTQIAHMRRAGTIERTTDWLSSPYVASMLSDTLRDPTRGRGLHTLPYLITLHNAWES